MGCSVQGVKMIESDEGCYSMLWAAARDKTGIVNRELYERVGILLKTKSKPRSNPKLLGELWEWTEKALASY